MTSSKCRGLQWVPKRFEELWQLLFRLNLWEVLRKVMKSSCAAWGMAFSLAWGLAVRSSMYSTWLELWVIMNSCNVILYIERQLCRRGMIPFASRSSMMILARFEWNEENLTSGKFSRIRPSIYLDLFKNHLLIAHLCIVWNCSNKLHSPLHLLLGKWKFQYLHWSKPTTRVACWVRIGTEAKTAVRILNGALINKAGFCGATTRSEGLLPQHLMKKDGMIWKCWVAPWISVCHIFACFTLSYQTFMKDPADPCLQVVVERQVAGQGGELELLRCTLITFQRQGKSKYILIIWWLPCGFDTGVCNDCISLLGVAHASMLVGSCTCVACAYMCSFGSKPVNEV